MDEEISYWLIHCTFKQCYRGQVQITRDPTNAAESIIITSSSSHNITMQEQMNKQ